MEGETIAEIKEALQTYNVSTSTPGLAGEDRMDELRLRLEAARATEKQRTQGVSSSFSEFSMPSLNHLSMAEVKERLQQLGEETATPGISGDTRRQVLLERLVGAICGAGSTGEANDMLDELITTAPLLVPRNPEPAPEPEPEPKQKAPRGRAPPKQPVPEPKRPKTPPPQPLSNSEISDIKRQIKRIENKRAVKVAARLSGSAQDPDLKKAEKLESKAESELSRMRGLRPAPGAKVSSLLIEGGAMLPIDYLLPRLEDLRDGAR